ncbi:unnamed protein product [Effrenium voratum]|uniref:Protein kinase domain-containing protein n=1 Tax=Effrenium voratum TaxID=2562239 RepID=A0AA36MMV7_9DINO|nr:unnamed protein product [Effrenium voratum]
MDAFRSPFGRGPSLGSTEWVENLQLQLGGAFTWATEESEDGFTINTQRYEINALLGEGSFGSVYRCTVEGQPTAVKILSTERIAMMTNCSQDIVLRRMLQEAEILGCLGGHPNIVQLRCAAVSKQTLRIYIVMQLLECNDLFTEMLRRRKPFTEHDAREAFNQLVMAVVHCHRRGVSHRDIKLENVMVASLKPFVIKLIDFGQAVMQDQHVEHQMRSYAKTLTTTSVYTPPEVQEAITGNLNYDAFKLDCFASGVVLYALLLVAWPQTGKPGDFEKHPKWASLSESVQDLIRGLLEPDPQKRLTMADASQHPWLSARGASLAPSRSTRSMTPLDRENEMQLLLETQNLSKALQRERGASCWLVSGSTEAENVCVWFRKSTDDCYRRLEEKLAFVPECSDLFGQLAQLHQANETLRELCRNSRQLSLVQLFDEVFSGYCRLNQDCIRLLGSCLEIIRSQEGVSTVELRLRMLMDISEQLGRERGFIAFYMGRPELLHTVETQLRFAKIQGCRQYLVGSTAPHMQSEVVSTAGGLLPSLRLTEAPVLSTSELEAVERAENAVTAGHTDTSEWFAFFTGMIDKVHQNVSMAVVSFIQDLGASGRIELPEQGNSVPSISASSDAMHSTHTPMGLDSSRGSRETMGMAVLGTLDDEGKRQYTPSSVKSVKSEVKSISSSVPPFEKPDYLSLLQAAARKSPNEDFLRSLRPNRSLLTQKEQTPVKLMPFNTPDPTPIHPGMFGGGGLGLAGYNLAQHLLMQPACPSQPMQVPVQDLRAPRATVVPPSGAKNVIISRGTIGHPTSCRGLGCKFASKERGCREGSECPRCHLCVWSRASEKAAERAET